MYWAFVWVDLIPFGILMFTIILCMCFPHRLTGFQVPPPVTSTGNIFSLRLTSDFAVSAHGFKLNYEGQSLSLYNLSIQVWVDWTVDWIICQCLSCVLKKLKRHVWMWLARNRKIGLNNTLHFNDPFIFVCDCIVDDNFGLDHINILMFCYKKGNV